MWLNEWLERLQVTNYCILEHQLRCDSFFTTVIFKWKWLWSVLWFTEVEGQKMCFNQLWMCLVLVYLTRRERRPTRPQPPLTVPGHVTTHKLRTEGEKKKITLASVCHTTHTHTTLFLLHHNNTNYSRADACNQGNGWCAVQHAML